MDKTNRRKAETSDMSEITDERRLEVMAWLEHRSKKSGATGIINQRNARDILAMLDEHDALPCPCVSTNGHGEFWAGNPTPTITFRPWTPAKPKLDQMPEGERHRCLSPMGYEVLTERIGDYAVRVWPNYPSSISSRYPDYSGRYTVLDAQPPQPKTLADVPDQVVVELETGAWVFKEANHVYEFGYGTGVPSDQCDGKINRVLGYPVLNTGKEE